MKQYFDFDPSVVNGNPKTRSLNPATYTENTNLFSEYSGESANLLIDLTASLVEKLNLLLDTGNYSIKDLGFTKFTRHRYHVAGYAVITREPTCAQQGELTIYCKLCGQAVATESIPKTSNHSWNNGTVIVAPSCTNNGWTQYKCTVCNVVRNEQPPALGHAWSYTETLTPGEDDAHGTARYTCTRCQQTKDGLLCAGEVFTDMPAEGNWAHKPIDWAYFSGITSGKTATTFAPKATITRAEAMTFLWTAAGKPKPTLTESPFTDVTPGKYYYKPVLWAVENKITTGKTATTFAPKAQCSRAEIMTFLWNALGKPSPSAGENPFTDVQEGKYYYKPILWAYENGVTSGTTDTTFSPKAVCNRAQVVTFLYELRDQLHSVPGDS